MFKNPKLIHTFVWVVREVILLFKGMPTAIIIEDIFSKEERRDIIKQAEPYWIDGEVLGEIEGEDWVYPGRQTQAGLQYVYGFQEYLKRITDLINEKTGKNLTLIRAWLNQTNGYKKDINWHDPRKDGDYVCTYYLKCPLIGQNGTLFREYGMVKAKENSLLLFPSDWEHTAPTTFWNNPFHVDRYVMSIDLLKPS